MGGGCKAAYHLSDPVRLDQSANVNSAVRSPSLIGYTGQIVRTLPVEGGDEVLGCPNTGETSEHDSGAVGDVDHRVIEACVDFLCHFASSAILVIAVSSGSSSACRTGSAFRHIKF